MELTETIKSNLAVLLCPVHDIHPAIETWGGEVEIICCCQSFHKQCLEEAERMVAEMDVTPNLNFV